MFRVMVRGVAVECSDLREALALACAAGVVRGTRRGKPISEAARRKRIAYMRRWRAQRAAQRKQGT